ncbi:MAG: aminopeptidase P N-terminal domain-containing protein [Proteobacteria bacterium]|nr:aminopeptidase P N-terminal domain-containing protein [Pseudomonadota bacterium]MDA0862004.1 aminopeptidase P N-terminal domain-containing protein [Pseudomonadota bacterium]MDA1031443.1 aminopeptidase P N-terminal domain-containing protein [Pseudomonadota bacterium]
MKTQFVRRRHELASAIKFGIAVIPTAAERIRNKDAHFPYRFDSYFHYLTGFNEPEAVLVVIGGKPSRSILFCRAKHEEREIWDGFRYGPEEAKTQFNFDDTFAIDEIDKILPQLIENKDAIFTPIGIESNWDNKMMGWLNKTRSRAREGITAPASLIDVREILDEMRLIKDSDELDVMRRAAKISAEAHVNAMLATEPEKYEYEIEAELLYHFKKKGSQFPAYTSIVAGGKNACVLHYIENNAVLNDGDLLLIDAGCELDGYASDITRTFPVSGKFSGPQRIIYELVLDAQQAAMEATSRGNSWQAPHDAATKVLAQGFIDLKLCHGSLDKVLENREYSRYYMHRTGHWLGRDVHDVGNYKDDGQWRSLEPGMVLTIEPGCYIRSAPDIPEQFWNIGIRIEDDAIVNQDSGCEIITSGVPKTINDIESLMSA